MKRFSVACLLLACITQAYAQSKYDAREAFNPQFYPYPGNEFRSASGEPGPKYWQNRADYRIETTLDSTNHTVKGKMEMTYTNNSPDNLGFLWMQVDQNIYRKDSRATATSTASGGRWANTGFTEGDVIKSITVEYNGKKYTPKYQVNDTRMQVLLQDALKSSGGKLKLIVDYSFTVPEYGTDRMGRLNTKNGWVYEVAQWYPRMCVYDDIQGWNVLPYLGQGEFYLEYGDIEYSITAPASMMVVGSGELLNPAETFTPAELAKYNAAKSSDKTVVIRSEADVNAKKNAKPGTRTWRFKINQARDVAWGASNAFVLDAAKINLPSGKKCMAISAYPVESITKDARLNDAGGQGWQRSSEMVKGAIEHYSDKWFEFPYPAATNVAGIVGGMEYPGIVFCSYKSSGAGLWGVTDHEFGHTWFPMIVGSNERKYAWMDEGFNTFINGLSTAAFHNGEFKKQSFFDDPSSSQMVQYVFGDKMDGLYTEPDVIQQRNLGVAAYLKPAMMLNNLRDNILGPERFDAAFREYVKRWAFKHPTQWDFFHTMENVGGEDLGWFWRGWVLNNWRIDVATKGVVYSVDGPAKGSVIVLENLEKMPVPVTVLAKESNGKEYKVDLPVEIWQHGGNYGVPIPSTSEITQVVVDPDKKLPDWNRENNTWKK